MVSTTPFILAKLHIWSSRRCTKSPSFDVFKEIVDIKYRTKKYIASKYNTERKFRQNGRYTLIIDQKCKRRENSSENSLRTRPRLDVVDKCTS